MAPRHNTGQQNVERKIIMAIDFGTTYSGLAWAQTGKPEIQCPVTQWPDATSGGLESATSDKVPSEIQYTDDSFKWGFQIGESGQRHQWFKLGLDSSQPRGIETLAAKYPDPNAVPQTYGRNPEELVKDYLTALRGHAERVLWHKLPQSALNSTPLEFVITVPAVWSDRAQASTRRCAELAGMGTGSSLHIITEPEAAAMYALDAMDPHNIKVGDTFVLCDAGGGTVDLISYKVSRLKPLCITEAAPGSGSLCGSTFLDRIFYKFLEERFNDDPNWDDDVVEEAMKRFEVTVKRSFNRDRSDKYYVPVPGLKDNSLYNVRRGRLRLTGSDVSTIFEPVIKEVINLVNSQINATEAQVKAVLLVGGFSQSAYLRDRIRQAVASRGIETMQSPNSWTAVVRGALMKGLTTRNSSFTPVQISGRSARKSYGVEVDCAFDGNADNQGRRYWSPYFGEYRIRKMDWFIQKGEITEENKPRRIKYNQHHLAGGRQLPIVQIVVYTCANNDHLGLSKYKDARVQRLVLVSAHLSRIPLYTIPEVLGADGQFYYDIDFAVEVTCYSGHTTYELIHNNINYGPVAAEYV